MAVSRLAFGRCELEMRGMLQSIFPWTPSCHNKRCIEITLGSWHCISVHLNICWMHTVTTKITVVWSLLYYATLMNNAALVTFILYMHHQCGALVSLWVNILVFSVLYYPVHIQYYDTRCMCRRKGVETCSLDRKSVV
jgi:hypothetical protein